MITKNQYILAKFYRKRTTVGVNINTNISSTLNMSNIRSIESLSQIPTLQYNPESPKKGDMIMSLNKFSDFKAENSPMSRLDQSSTQNTVYIRNHRIEDTVLHKVEEYPSFHKSMSNSETNINQSIRRSVSEKPEIEIDRKPLKLQNTMSYLEIFPKKDLNITGSSNPRHSVCNGSKTNSSNVTPSFKFGDNDSVDLNLTPRDPNIMSFMKSSYTASFDGNSVTVIRNENGNIRRTSQFKDTPELTHRGTY